MPRELEVRPQERVVLNDHEATLAGGYTKYIKSLFPNIGFNLPWGRYKPSIYEPAMVRDAAYYDDKLTMGISGISPDTMAILLSIPLRNQIGWGQYGEPIRGIIPLPNENGSGLLIDPETNTLHTDFFLTAENNVFKVVKTTQPIQIDGYIPMYDNKRDAQVAETLLPANSYLFELTEDKFATKELFKNEGINVPLGIFIEPDSTQTAASIEKFASTSFSQRGFVVKGNNGSGGENVKLFEPTEVAEAVEFANKLHQKGMGVLVEKRIHPAPISINDINLNKELAKQSDYNLRVIVTVGENPSIVDSEVRFNLKDGNPVNIKQGAKAVRPLSCTFGSGYSESQRIESRINATALDCAHVLSDYLKDAKSTESVGFVGLDLMIDESGTVYVIEANSGAVGGFGTLYSLDKRPLASIRETLVPSMVPNMRANHEKRQPAEELEQLPWNKGDRLAFLASNAYADQFDKVMEMANSESEEDSHVKSAQFSLLGTMAYNRGRVPEGLDLMRKAYDARKDPYFLQNLAATLISSHNYEEADKLLAEGLEDQKNRLPYIVELKALVDKIKSGSYVVAEETLEHYQNPLDAEGMKKITRTISLARIAYSEKEAAEWMYYFGKTLSLPFIQVGQKAYTDFKPLVQIAWLLFRTRNKK